MIGGSFAIFQETGAVEFSIRRLTDAISKRPYLEGALIPLLMLVFSLGGSIFGMSEETIPFVLIFIPLARRLGYDSIVGAAIPFLGAAAGFAAAFFNPFTVGISQSIAGIPLYSGLGYRMVSWVIGTVVIISYVMWYARRVKRNPEISPVRDIDLEREAVASRASESDAWDVRHVATLTIFVASMVLLVVGVLKWQWYIDQIAVLFFGNGHRTWFCRRHGAEPCGAHVRHRLRRTWWVWCSSWRAPGALLVIAQEAKVLDTILYGTSNTLSVLPRGIIAQVMFLIQCVINFFIHSGTAQAALTMPIMAPLADLVGITRQTAVYAYQLCEFINPILPTSAVTMGVLGAAKIPWERWARWFLPLMLILVVLSFLLLIPPVLFFKWE